MNQYPPNKTQTRQRIKYIVADILSALLVWVSFLIFRWLVYENLIFGIDTVLVPAFSKVLPLFVFPVYCLLIHYLSGYYVNPFRKTAIKEFFTTLISAIIISLGAFFIIILDDEVPSYRGYYVSLATLFVLQFGISYLFRLIITHNTRKLIRRGVIRQNTVLIGTGKNARRLANELRASKDEVRIVGFVSEKPQYEAADDIIGCLDDFATLKTTYDISSTIVALDDNTSENELFKIIDQLFPYGTEILFTPHIYQLLTGSTEIYNLAVSPLVNITKVPMADWETCVKRAMDIVLSIIALIIASPLMLFCIIAIKINSPGPAFYTQERIGLFGKPFNILKLRTMIVDAEKGCPMLSNPNDQRVTSFGRWLRKYRIDEVPQFINILRGEMSLIGPRPERKFYIEQIVKKAPYYCLLYKIKPGLTSWGQIKIGYADTVDKMIERLNYNIIYVNNMSLREDVKILLCTIEVIIKGKGL